MSLDPRTPVLVGVAAVSQRHEDPQRAPEAIKLMTRALEHAADDAGNYDLLTMADSVRVPRGLWDYSDPGRLVADRLVGNRARTELAEIGVLQTTLLGGAARDIAAGKADVVLVTGGEAKYRSRRAEITGKRLSITLQPASARPDVVLKPADEIMHPLEIEHGLVMPVGQYAMIENATRAAAGLSIEEHRREIARMWSDFSRVAAGNPAAWNRSVVAADTIREASDTNRMLAFPYAKLHNSNWNVDQAAGLILCSVEAARRYGIAEDRWVFPLAVAESNFMQPISARGQVHRSPGFAHAGARVLTHAGLTIDEVAHLELYSCFPVAVRVQAAEMGIAAARQLTVTGGMAFAGGPLNNFVLQGLVRTAELLRAERGSHALLTAVSGMLTKQGVSLWSSQPPAQSFAFDDVSADVERDVDTRDVVAPEDGHATVATYTVMYDGAEPVRALLLCDLDGGRRTMVATDDRDLAATMTREEPCGRRVKIVGGRCAGIA